MRVNAAVERRRQLIYRKTGEDVPQENPDKKYNFDRNDYNYLMIFATSESELREALTDIILYRASPDAPFDVNELLQDIQRVDNLLEGFRKRFDIPPDRYERMKFEFDGREAGPAGFEPALPVFFAGLFDATFYSKSCSEDRNPIQAR